MTDGASVSGSSPGFYNQARYRDIRMFTPFEGFTLITGRRFRAGGFGETEEKRGWVTGRALIFEDEELIEGYIEGGCDVHQGIQATGADAGFNPLNKGAVFLTGIGQIFLRQAAFLSIVEDVQSNFDPVLVMLHIHSINPYG